MALRTRRKSTCRRTTSSGSVTLMNPGSHVTNRTVQAPSGMWTGREVGFRGTRMATCRPRRLFPARVPGPCFVAARSSALAYPAEPGLGGGRPGRRLVLAVAPGAARALLVLPLPARDADHVSIVRQALCGNANRRASLVLEGPGGAVWSGAALGGVRAAHAAAALGRALILVQATPRAVLFRA